MKAYRVLCCARAEWRLAVQGIPFLLHGSSAARVPPIHHRGFSCCMSALFPLRFRRNTVLTLIPLLLFTIQTASAQALDLNHNGASDVWEALYGADGLDPNADTDGDGVPNRLEAIAGTDPFDPNSVPRIEPFSVTANSARLSMAGALGKRYELQASEVLCGVDGTNWYTEASVIARTNPFVTLTAPAERPTKFFRMLISDVDTDGDGLS